jgi:hypothetical protein
VHCSRGFVWVAPGMATQAATGLMPAATHVHFLPHQSPQAPVWQTGSQPTVGTVFEEHAMTGGGQGSPRPESPMSVVPPVPSTPPASPAVGAKLAFVQASVQTNRAAKQLDRSRWFLMSQSSGVGHPSGSKFATGFLAKRRGYCARVPMCLPTRQTWSRYRG